MRRLLLTTAVLIATLLGAPASVASAAELCPATATFPFAIPGGVVPWTGTGPILGEIVTSETGTFPVCTGSFVVMVVGIETPIAVGDFRAVHGGAQLSAKFEGTLFAGTPASIEFEGKLKFSSATGMGSVRTDFSLPAELKIKFDFSCSIALVCGPTSPPVVTIHTD